MKKIFLLSSVLLFALTSCASAQTKVVYSTSDEEIPVVKNCTVPTEQGGWGGVCRDSIFNAGAANTVMNGCINAKTIGSWTTTSDAIYNVGSFVTGNGLYYEQFVGYCSIDSGDQCCVEESKIPQNPAKDMYSTKFISDNLCAKPVSEGGFGGSCNDQDAGLTWGLAGEDPTCANGEAFVSYCDQGLDSKAGCCVPREGEYCKKVEAAGGACSGGATGIGTAAALEYGDYQLLESIPGSSSDASDLPTYLQNIYQAGLVLIVLGAIFMIGMGGFTYIASAGNTHTMAKGKGMIQDALYGLIIALATWLILNIINPDLVNLTIETPSTLDFAPSTDNEVGLDATSGGGASGGGCTAIPDSQLVTFPAGSTDGKGVRRGTADTVKRFMAMREAALKESIDLRAGNAYRSPGEAEDLWKSHGCQIVNGKTSCKGSLVAKPCSLGGAGSNHTRGTAIDIQTNTAGTNWMRKNAAQYGFYNKVASEPWHWSSDGH